MRGEQNGKLQKERSEFYEAAGTRQNLTQCEQGDLRAHALQAIGAEINAFNDLIATYCDD
jgi:hypothetical protein